MIKTEYLKDDTLIRHYSDIGMTLRQIETGIVYQEAVDVVPCQYTYEETGEDVDLTDAEALNIITGGGVYEAE